ncbi:MAG: alpha/beta hydrolase [Firmicutes bacterium]|nr:alpha/beta hydrolase [Bacillota bacterium]
MIKFEAKNTTIYYHRHLGSNPVILLHGWGGSHISMLATFNYLSKFGLDIINIDLPGFGNSPNPPEFFTLEDYAETIKELIEKLSLSQVTLIGHSFGARIAILLAKEKFVKNLILTGAAGIKPKFSFKKYIRIKQYKRAVKKGKDISQYGSSDYKQLPDNMRKVFNRIINRHLENDLKDIFKPVLLIWGKKDLDTPLYMAKKMNKLINDSALIVFDGGHYVYIDKNKEFNLIAKKFIIP